MMSAAEGGPAVAGEPLTRTPDPFPQHSSVRFDGSIFHKLTSIRRSIYGDRRFA